MAISLYFLCIFIEFSLCCVCHLRSFLFPSSFLSCLFVVVAYSQEPTDVLVIALKNLKVGLCLDVLLTMSHRLDMIIVSSTLSHFVPV